ncbi:MAG: DUF6519 domain-containing protein [Verrucomicrobiota bacterium]
MKGDFSTWEFDPLTNFNGVLYQQGRVSLDTDGNAQTQIANHWQDTAASDIIGPNVAAVSTSEKDSFKILSAGDVDQQTLWVQLAPGHIWVNGKLIHLHHGKDGEGSPRTLQLNYYRHPLIPPVDPSSIDLRTRDAVVLEVWRETINGFQVPKQLLEPALGGIDTTERLHTSMRLRLLRLEGEQNCHDVRKQLLKARVKEKEFKGRLLASLQPTTQIAGDCPVVEGGGYAGMEHYLYRIEIAETNDELLTFKWSQFNGGLVGRGRFIHSATSGDKVEIMANLQAIATSGLDQFYLEALQFNKERGHWEIIYGAEATLNNINDLELSSSPHFGTLPASDKTVFFRLWNGILPLSDYTKLLGGGSGEELRDGIRLAFDDPSLFHYYSGDYWTFKVRASGIGNPELLVPDLKPEGIEIDRVPLGVITWERSEKAELIPRLIEDCRKRFHPLTQLDGCCTYRVGDGVTSFGDFDSIQEAIDALPEKRGGQICLLPGTFRESVVIKHRRSIKIVGCGWRSIVEASPSLEEQDSKMAATFRILGSKGILLENFMIQSSVTGKGIYMEGMGYTSRSEKEMTKELSSLESIYIQNMWIQSVKSSIYLVNGKDVKIQNCWMRVRNRPGSEPTVFLQGDDIYFEKNKVEMSDRRRLAEEMELGSQQDIAEHLEEVKEALASLENSDEVKVEGEEEMVIVSSEHYVEKKSEQEIEEGHSDEGAWNSIDIKDEADKGKLEAHPGGVQIGGGSERVHILDNLILGGSGNGITLGHFDYIDEKGDSVAEEIWVEASGKGGKEDHLCAHTQPAVASYLYQIDGKFRKVGGFLYDISIKENRIYRMGLNGIGVPGFFPLEQADEMVSVNNLTIVGNDIRGCLRRKLSDTPEKMLDEMGYGGIALAWAYNLVIKGNLIEKNGRDYLDPVSGIFVLYGEGVEIASNRVLHNGEKKATSPKQAKQGKRGGITIANATPPMKPILFKDKMIPVPSGVPAVSIRDNIVSTPLGQALSVEGIGQMSIEANQLHSYGQMPLTEDSGFQAVTVDIRNLGMSQEIYGGFTAFAMALGKGSKNVQKSGNKMWGSEKLYEKSSGLGSLGIGRFLIGGQVLFNDNQVTLDLFETGKTVSLCSTLVVTFDDISFRGNQCAASLSDDILLANALLFGFSLRAGGNRFQETLMRAAASLFSLSIAMNNTSGNQATHCVVVRSFVPVYIVDKPNTEMVPAFCESMEETVLPELAKGNAKQEVDQWEDKA